MSRFIIRKDSSGHYYWILKSDKNGETVAKSSESYESKQGVMNSVSWTKNNAASATVEDETK